MSKASGELTKTHELKQVKKNIARILTVINEQEGSKV
jgi:ribosomal protein L29